MRPRARGLVLAAAGAMLPSCGEVLPSAEPPPAPVTVTVLTASGDGAPDPSARVLFQGPDGALVADVPVDAKGRAEAVLPGGGAVSAIRILADTPAGLTASITSTLGVQPATI